MKFKRISALLTAGILGILSMMTVFAAEAEPSYTDTKTITVNNVEESVTVTAYHIISATYDSKGNGLTGYAVADGVSIENIEYPTAEEVTTITKNINAGTLTLDSVTLSYQSNDTYTAEVTAGMWLILVSDCNETIYNPMIVSNWYEDANLASSLTEGAVDANSRFVEGVYSNDVYAKKDSKTYDKQITDSDAGTGNDYGTEGHAGDTVTFTITDYIPDYSDAYDTSLLTYTITDTLSAGLAAISASDISVKVSGTSYAQSYIDKSTGLTVYNYTIDCTENEDGSETIVIDFVRTFIMDHTAEDVEIVYSTIIDEDAEYAENGANTNEMTITYSNSPKTTYTTDQIDNYVYTFALTDEVVKVNTDGTVSAVGTDVTTTNGLENAEFTFYTDAACTQVYTNSIFDGTAVSDENGMVSVYGLAQGNYYFTETEAPSGYYINDTVYQLVIEAEFQEDGTLSSYSTTVSELDDSLNVDTSTSKVSTYNLSYETDETVTVTASVNPTAIIDLDLQELPSTGGMGVYVIIAGSILLFGLGMVLMASKRLRA